MKRSLQFALVLACAMLCAALSSCDTPAGQVFTANAMKNLNAAEYGYLTGGKAGAIASLTAQEIANIKDRQKTAAKNPVNVVP